jgi:hypothetical protein
MNSKTSYSKKYGAICILDALGTKGIWKQKDPENVIQNWERFVTTIENNIIKNDKGIEYSLYAFSDTLIITASGKLSLEKLLFGLSVHLATLVAFGFP